jgi:hypothetical protein
MKQQNEDLIIDAFEKDKNFEELTPLAEAFS